MSQMGRLPSLLHTQLHRAYDETRSLRNAGSNAAAPWHTLRHAAAWAGIDRFVPSPRPDHAAGLHRGVRGVLSTNDPATQLRLDPAQWGKPVEQVKGLTLWRADTSPTPTYLVKGTIDAPLDLVLASIVDVGAARPWLHADRTGELAKHVDVDRGTMTGEWYYTQKLPMVGERLFKLQTTATLHPSTGQVSLVTHHIGNAARWDAAVAKDAIRSDPKEKKALAQIESKLKQVKSLEAVMLLTPRPDGKTDMTVRFGVNPNVRGLSLVPASMKNSGVRDAATDQIVSVIKRLRDDPARFEKMRTQLLETFPALVAKTNGA